VFEPGPCLFLEAEGNRDRFRDRVLTARRSLGLEGRELPLFFAPRGAAFEIGDGLESMIKECSPSLVVLDTIGLFHEGEENSNTDWKKFVVKPLRRIIETTRTAFLLLHHFGKPSEARTGGQRVRGASAIKGDVDSLLLLEPAKSGCDLRVLTFDKIKNGPPLDSIVIRFDGERAVFERTSEDAVTALKPRLAEVHRIVLESGDVTTAELKAAIKGATGLSDTQAEGLIASAREAGLIERRKRGVYGLPGTLLVAGSTTGGDVPF
jgi:RecA-family ATPase